MHHRKIHHHDMHDDIQSVLIHKGHKIHTLEQAKHKVKKLGFNPDYKKLIDETQNFYRFRQHNPIEDARYRTIQLDSERDLAVIQHPTREPLGRNPNTWTPKHLMQPEKKQMLGQDPKTYTPMPKPMPGQNGGGIRKPEFQYQRGRLDKHENFNIH